MTGAPGDRGLPPVPRGWWAASLAGAGVAFVLFAYVLLVGRSELTAAPTGDFYDLQVRAWFDGRWDIPPARDDDGRVRTDALGNPITPLSIEAIVVDGRAYLYYGPVPSLLRVPLLAATDALDGETTQPAMAAAFLVAMAGVTVLHWRIRALVRGPGAGDAVGRGGAALAGAVTFLAGCGTVVLFLGSQPTVYHEANLWGLAFSVWAYAAVLALQARPSVRGVVTTGALAALALLSRASVGIGPVVALGLVALVHGWRWWRARSTGGDARARPAVLGALVAACVVPVALYAAVNLVRFGEPFRLPLEKQVFSQFDEQRIAALEANDGSLFSASYLPSTLWQYTRPDALDLDGLLPWLTFPRTPATVIGDATFDTRDEASSIPASMPLWAVLAVVGAVVLVRRGRSADDGVHLLWIPVVGAAAGVGGVLVIGFIAHRYLGDVLPLLLVLGLLGVQAAVAWARRAPRPVRTLVAADLAVLAAFSVAVNLALSLEYQRLIAPVDPRTRTAFVAAQLRWAGDVDEPVTVTHPEQLPRDSGERGELRVLVDPDGSCTGAYWSDGYSWIELPGGHQVCDALPVRWDEGQSAAAGTSSTTNW